jgi:hypothetical protein
MILRRRTAAALLCPILASAPTAARADGAYGRFDGDLGVRAGAGAALAQGGAALCAGAAAVFLETAGLYVHYTDALGQDGPSVARSIAAGVHLQPLFLGRYGTNREDGPPRLDLFVDSIALGVGAFWGAPRDRALSWDPGLELALSLSFPLLPDATGPFLGLRGALRWRSADLDGAGSGDALDRGALVSLTLSWHHMIAAHLVDAGDGALRAARE